HPVDRDDPSAGEQAVTARRRAIVEIRDVNTRRRDAALHRERAMRLLQQGAGPRDDAIEVVAVELDRRDRLGDLASVPPDRHFDLGLLRRALDVAERADERAVDAEQDVAGAEEFRCRRAADRARYGEELAPPRAVRLVLPRPGLGQREL